MFNTLQKRKIKTLNNMPTFNKTMLQNFKRITMDINNQHK